MLMAIPEIGGDRLEVLKVKAVGATPLHMATSKKVNII